MFTDVGVEGVTVNGTQSSLEQHIVSDQIHVRLSLQKIGFM